MEIGDWIDFGPKLIEITSITHTDIIGLYIEYNKPTFKLQYGEPVVLSKSYFFRRTDNG